MKYERLISILLIAVWSFMCGRLAYVVVDERQRLITATGSNVAALETAKRECEKSLPRNKECVMVFDFVQAEADYD